MTEIDAQVTSSIRNVLGSLYGELLQVMVDLAVPPIFLTADDRPRLVEIRERALTELRAWVASHPDHAAALVDLLPDVMVLPDPAESLIETAPWDDYFRLPSSTFEPPSPSSPVYAEMPALLALADDDGLLDVRDLDARPHGVFVGELSLHYHQLLRRNFNSNIHYDLIGTVLALAEQNRGNRVRIAVDERRLRRRDEHKEFEERDYWYGPPLDEAKLDDLISVGETVHGDPQCGRSIRCPYWALSIRWTRNERPLKSVAIEEFLPLDEQSSAPILARYLHAIRDTERRVFVHCDAAVKAYDQSTYPADLSAFARRAKGLHYRKVFRLDGSLTTAEWSQLTALWFRGNPLVLEYLAGSPPAEPGHSNLAH